MINSLDRWPKLTCREVSRQRGEDLPSKQMLVVDVGGCRSIRIWYIVEIIGQKSLASTTLQQWKIKESSDESMDDVCAYDRANETNIQIYLFFRRGTLYFSLFWNWPQSPFFTFSSPPRAIVRERDFLYATWHLRAPPVNSGLRLVRWRGPARSGMRWIRPI